MESMAQYLVCLLTHFLSDFSKSLFELVQALLVSSGRTTTSANLGKEEKEKRKKEGEGKRKKQEFMAQTME